MQKILALLALSISFASIAALPEDLESICSDVEITQLDKSKVTDWVNQSNGGYRNISLHYPKPSYEISGIFNNILKIKGGDGKYYPFKEDSLQVVNMCKGYMIDDFVTQLREDKRRADNEKIKADIAKAEVEKRAKAQAELAAKIEAERQAKISAQSKLEAEAKRKATEEAKSKALAKAEVTRKAEIEAKRRADEAEKARVAPINAEIADLNKELKKIENKLHQLAVYPTPVVVQSKLKNGPIQAVVNGEIVAIVDSTGVIKHPGYIDLYLVKVESLFTRMEAGFEIPVTTYVINTDPQKELRKYKESIEGQSNMNRAEEIKMKLSQLKQQL